MNTISIQPVARIRSDFPSKFGIPRQSGIVNTLQATIIFEPEFRNADALRGLEAFTHLWLIWHFSESAQASWSPTVRPPRLGGNTRLGVFATRSPFRPNPIGLSSVRILGIEKTQDYGSVIHISGADLMDGTPIFDLKPYVPYCDCHTDASGGFTDSARDFILNVNFPSEHLQTIPESKREALLDVLSHDPRPSYQNDPERVYGLRFAKYDIHFKVCEDTLTVIDVINI